MYLGSIIGYLSWPFMIGVSYLAVRWALRIFEKKWEAGSRES
ncbi:MAG: hypothetical protein R2751_06385 [Bacteroidales bacterium]